MALRAQQEILTLLREYQFLTPKKLADIRHGKTDRNAQRIEQRNLNLLFQAKKAHRFLYFDLTAIRGKAGYVYCLDSEKRPRTLDHELDIVDYHIALKKLCVEQGWDLVWQQKHMSGKLYPDAYFSVRGFHFFLEVERQEYGNVKDGKPSIIRKADGYYMYYDSEECFDRWGFRQFRVIFQLMEIKPDDFLSRLPAHRMFWVGQPGDLMYRTPKGDALTFVDV